MFFYWPVAYSCARKNRKNELTLLSLSSPIMADATHEPAVPPSLPNQVHRSLLQKPIPAGCSVHYAAHQIAQEIPDI